MSYDLVCCHGVLQKLLSEVARGPDPWEGFSPEGSYSPPAVCTFADIDQARAVCKMWKKTVDASPEYATIRLARWDYSQLVGVAWVAKDEYKVQRFNYSWNYFSNCWKMAIPFSDSRFRDLPLHELSISELAHLHERLAAPENTPLAVGDGQKVHPRFEYWIAPAARW